MYNKHLPVAVPAGFVVLLMNAVEVRLKKVISVSLEIREGSDPPEHLIREPIEELLGVLKLNSVMGDPLVAVVISLVEEPSWGRNAVLFHSLNVDFIRADGCTR